MLIFCPFLYGETRFAEYFLSGKPFLIRQHPIITSSDGTRRKEHHCYGAQKRLMLAFFLCTVDRVEFIIGLWQIETDKERLEKGQEEKGGARLVCRVD